MLARGQKQLEQLRGSKLKAGGLGVDGVGGFGLANKGAFSARVGGCKCQGPCQGLLLSWSSVLHSAPVMPWCRPARSAPQDPVQLQQASKALRAAVAAGIARGLGLSPLSVWFKRRCGAQEAAQTRCVRTAREGVVYERLLKRIMSCEGCT